MSEEGVAGSRNCSMRPGNESDEFGLTLIRGNPNLRVNPNLQPEARPGARVETREGIGVAEAKNGSRSAAAAAAAAADRRTGGGRVRHRAGSLRGARSYR